jgi:hypothetical protein
VLFSDTFSDPDLWNTVQSPTASAIVERGELALSIAANQPTVALVSMRSEPMVNDFYAEVTGRLRLCRASDTYGMLFRAASEGDTYRVALNCNGQARLERVLYSQVAVLVDWMVSPDIPRGAPGEIRIGVWAVDRELRIYLNDRLLISAWDGTFHSGALGLFTTSRTDTPTSISFSAMEAYLVSYTSPTPTTTITATPTATRTPRFTATP